MSAKGNGLVCAYVLDGRGGGRQLSWEELLDSASPPLPLWLHFDRSEKSARDWIRATSGIDAAGAAALLAEGTRPRSVVLGDAILANLRGANFTPGASPDEMVALRMWVEADRIITVRHRHVRAIDDLRDNLEAGVGPTTAPEVLAAVATNLARRLDPILSELEDQFDDLEDRILAITTDRSLRAKLRRLQRKIINFRRYLAPQREALSQLHSENVEWLSNGHRILLRDAANSMSRFVESLDAIRDRANLVNEQFLDQLTERSNRVIYVLSLTAAIFLPLDFLTGLFGVRLAGVPGVENNASFVSFVAGLAILVALQVFLFRRFRWFGFR